MSEPIAGTSLRVRPGCCPKCGQHIGRRSAVARHARTCSAMAAPVQIPVVADPITSAATLPDDNWEHTRRRARFRAAN